MQLATPRLVAIAVRMAITVCSTNFQVSSFFIVLGALPLPLPTGRGVLLAIGGL